jgi:hypothetical protein
MRVILQLPLLLSVLLATRAESQSPLPPPLPEPRLIDSPWGDFPLQRLQPGARLRVTSLDGQRSEAQLITLSDSAIELRTPSGAPVITSMTLSDLRALRAFEVRAFPATNRRNEIGGLIAGAALGALIGAVVHKDPPDGTGKARAGRGERIATTAGSGALFGWYIGWRVLGRARWRPVTLP